VCLLIGEEEEEKEEEKEEKEEEEEVKGRILYVLRTVKYVQSLVRD